MSSPFGQEEDKEEFLQVGVSSLKLMCVHVVYVYTGPSYGRVDFIQQFALFF